MKFDKKIVTAIVVLNVLFAYKILDVFVKTGSEPSALVVAWFAFTTGELWSLSKIKRAKINKEEQKNDINH